jgi:hypothetical protein
MGSDGVSPPSATSNGSGLERYSLMKLTMSLIWSGVNDSSLAWPGYTRPVRRSAERFVDRPILPYPYRDPRRFNRFGQKPRIIYMVMCTMKAVRLTLPQSSQYLKTLIQFLTSYLEIPIFTKFRIIRRMIPQPAPNINRPVDKRSRVAA